MDTNAALKEMKEKQKLVWATFAPIEALTTPPAARLVRHARVQFGQRVLDVACGTGVVAVTAALQGARVTGLDLTPALLERARENAALAGAGVDWHEGDVEALPFADASFETVLSQFGHMFAPRPEVALAEMLRVLKPGGIIAFSTWPPELMTGRMFALAGRYNPPREGIAPPPLWGDPGVIAGRLGAAVGDLAFDRGTMLAPALSPAHVRATLERNVGPLTAVVELLSGSDLARLAKFRGELESIVAEYIADNTLRQDYLMTRARKLEANP